MIDYTKILLAVAPHGKATIRAGFAAALPDCTSRASLATSLRLAHFLAQCAHESAGLATTVEFASGRAYEGRRDLGNIEVGDGPRFKGRGLIQTTGRENYEIETKALSVDFICDPKALGEFPYAAISAADYWARHNINVDADIDSVEGVTRRVNGGLNGLASRTRYLARAKHALTDLSGALAARAAEETAAAVKKGAVSGVSLSGAFVAASTATGAAHPITAPLLALLSIGFVAGALWLGFNILKHREAAALLTEAAKGE